MKQNNKKTDEFLDEITKIKEENDKRLLSLEIVIGFLGIFILLSFTFLAEFLDMADWFRILLIIIGFVVGLIAVFIALKLEQIAGYYECGKCHHKYVPDYTKVLWAMHIGRTRFMRCPKCNERSWNKKVISK